MRILNRPPDQVHDDSPANGQHPLALPLLATIGRRLCATLAWLRRRLVRDDSVAPRLLRTRLQVDALEPRIMLNAAVPWADVDESDQ